LVPSGTARRSYFADRKSTAVRPGPRQTGSHHMTSETIPITRSPAGATGASAAPESRRLRWARRAPLLPALLFMIVVTQLPFAATLLISFRRWNALDPTRQGWAGLANYRAV